MLTRPSGLSTAFLLIVVLAGFVALLMMNARPAVSTLSTLPTQISPTVVDDAWSRVLREGFGQNSTPLPTVAIPTARPTSAVLVAAAGPSATPISAADLAAAGSDLSSLPLVTPTLPPLVPGQPQSEIAVQAVTRAPNEWNPPPLIPPISRHPLGYDHYWLRRPIESNARNSVLLSYSFGSDGNDPNNPLRVHHGIDMPNPIGELVRASGSGEVVWAADGRQSQTDIFQNSPSYGNVVVIAHDFAFRGQPLYTLYAHLSAALVRPGDYVEAGQVIGLVGNTGRVSGPHVHFEVRMGENRYSETYNPILWMVPYVGHGVIAGQVINEQGQYLNDVDITVRSRRTGRTESTTTTYVFLGTSFDVRVDPNWRENFALPDIPVGLYDVIANIDGVRVLRQVEVLEGMTAFVELRLAPPPTATPEPAGDDG